MKLRASFLEQFGYSRLVSPPSVYVLLGRGLSKTAEKQFYPSLLAFQEGNGAVEYPLLRSHPRPLLAGSCIGTALDKFCHRGKKPRRRQAAKVKSHVYTRRANPSSVPRY